MDRLPVLVSGFVVSQLLAVPLLENRLSCLKYMNEGVPPGGWEGEREGGGNKGTGDLTLVLYLNRYKG